MSKSIDTVSKANSQNKSWADLDGDDFFASVANDKPKASPTSAWASKPTSERGPEKRTATSGGVPWAFPNPVQPQSTSSPTSNGAVSRFDSLSPNTRRSAPLGNWRK